MEKRLASWLLLGLICVASCLAWVLNSTAFNDDSTSPVEDIPYEEPDAPTGSWVQRFDGFASGADDARAMAVDSSGNVYVTGRSEAENGAFDYATLKYTANGKREWVKTYDGPAKGNDEACAVVVDKASNVYVTGRSKGEDGSYDFLTIKYTRSGKEAWGKRYAGANASDDQATALAVDSKGNVFVTGNSGTRNQDYLTIKYNAKGDRVWVKKYDGPGSGKDGTVAIAVDAKGNAILTGSSENSRGSRDFATLKILGSETSIPSTSSTTTTIIYSDSSSSTTSSTTSIRPSSSTSSTSSTSSSSAPTTTSSTTTVPRGAS